MAPQDSDCTAFRSVVLAVVALTLVTVGHAADFYLDAASSRGHPHIVKRSNASSGVAVRLGAGDSIQLTFCLRQTTVIQVQSVLYSNDGHNETVAVAVDDRSFLGTFTTRDQSDWGRLWNKFLPGPPLPLSLALPGGWHTLRVGVLGPSDGVEVDTVHVWLNDEGLTRTMLDCLLLCTSSVPSLPPNTARLWRQASARQASYPTQCAEEDNVKVPIYVDGISEYTVAATLPTYVSFANQREPNTTGCSFLTPLLFSFTGFPPDTSGSHSDIKLQPFSATAERASLFGLRSHSTGKQIFRIEFMLEGRSRGHVDAEIGSILNIHFKKASAEILVKASYIGRTGKLTALPNSVVSPGHTQHKLHVGDYTWRENGTNLVLLELQAPVPVHVTQVTMERRPMLGEKVHTVYRSDSVVVEAVEVDFWWRRPETMTLKNGETGQTWRPVDFFRISLYVPWNGGFAQVLVMYQDGNVRLAPLPPPGVDWVPFGSSVIIGHSNPSHLRPSAPVTSVTFHPSTLQLHLQYKDGGSARVKLSVTPTITKLTVHDIQGGKNNRELRGHQQQLPFATLRSMYIEDGNSDCDSVLVDGGIKTPPRPIMGRWGVLHGKSFFFYRRCESRHLTLSPDIRIDVKKMSGGVVSGTSKNNWWWQLYTAGDTAGQTKNGPRHPTNPYIDTAPAL